MSGGAAATRRAAAAGGGESLLTDRPGAACALAGGPVLWRHPLGHPVWDTSVSFLILTVHTCLRLVALGSLQVGILFLKDPGSWDGGTFQAQLPAVAP